MYDKTQATMERFRAMAQRIVIDEVDRMRPFNQTEQYTRLKSLREALDEYSLGKAPSSEADPYGYRLRMKETLRFSIGLLEGGDTDHFAAKHIRIMSTRT